MLQRRWLASVSLDISGHVFAALPPPSSAFLLLIVSVWRDMLGLRSGPLNYLSASCPVKWVQQIQPTALCTSSAHCPWRLSVPLLSSQQNILLIWIAPPQGVSVEQRGVSRWCKKHNSSCNICDTPSWKVNGSQEGIIDVQVSFFFFKLGSHL